MAGLNAYSFRFAVADCRGFAQRLQHYRGYSFGHWELVQQGWPVNQESLAGGRHPEQIAHEMPKVRV
jgi:hypothetical protein